MLDGAEQIVTVLGSSGCGSHARPFLSEVGFEARAIDWAVGEKPAAPASPAGVKVAATKLSLR
ncbi:hypothetical protein GCM10023198_44570 [Promicromonospora umidemergens]|uniref:Uncharacterized protein n=1 Tax=Promicromonospora umidemergens TaxID=629679 RepID=A0ABP8XWD2_9MICO